MFNDRIERTVLVIGRTAELDAGRAFSDDLLFERLPQPGLANTWLATEQHHLPCALFGLHPPLRQQSHFVLAPNEGSQASGDRHLKATLHRILADNAIQRQRSREAFQLLRATVLA